jgi:hypothetical protein
MDERTVATHDATMRRSLALLASVAALVAGGGAAATATSAPAIAVKTCSAGYVHAVIGGSEKCLRAGEFCTHRYDSQYRHYGFRCIRYYANVGRYRLTHS